MGTVPNDDPTNEQITDSRLPGTVAELRAGAVTALQPCNPLNREHVESMLLFWRRRPELTAADVAAVQEAMFPEPEDRTCANDSDPRVLPGFAHGLIEGYARAWGFAPRPRIPRDLALRNPDCRDGYTEGYLDAVRVATEPRELTTERFAAIVRRAIGDSEAAAALISLWDRRDQLTGAELDAIRAAATADDHGFAERFLARQRRQRRAATEDGGQ